MTRGNQRDKDRTKNQKKKTESKKKNPTENLTLQQRKQRDGDTMREKQKGSTDKAQSSSKN